jgi:hypothetical protein
LPGPDRAILFGGPEEDATVEPWHDELLGDATVEPWHDEVLDGSHGRTLA